MYKKKTCSLRLTVRTIASQAKDVWCSSCREWKALEIIELYWVYCKGAKRGLVYSTIL